MIDGVFVFDNAIHCYDMSEENLRDDRADAAHAHDLLLAGGDGGRWAGYNDGSIEFERKWTIEDLYELVFVDSPTDMAMAQTVPLFDWYRDSWAPVLTQHAMAERYPDRVMFCGGVDPLYHGVDGALEQLDWQIKELGARSIKFYNAPRRRVVGVRRPRGRLPALRALPGARHHGAPVPQGHPVRADERRSPASQRPPAAGP